MWKRITTKSKTRAKKSARKFKLVRIVGKNKNTRYLGESTYLGDKVYIYQTNTRTDAKKKRRALKAGRIIKATIAKKKKR